MFTYFLLSILLNYDFVEAAPLLVFMGRAADSSPAPLQRTLFGIIWSCLSTVVICAWTSVHPNVPPPNPWKARWNRLRLMFWMIIAPELVLAWAVRQFYAAREIRNVYNTRHPESLARKKWTLKHGHLLEMGGFALVDPEQKNRENKEEGTVLTLDYFREHPEIDSHIPEITAAEIEDRSKGDALSKIIAILQTTWFIVQCVARGEQRLALTELELVTLALASLNAVTFAIWWHKPLSLQEPVKIYIQKAEMPKIEAEGQQEENDNISFGDVFSKGWKLVKVFAGLIVDIFGMPCDCNIIGILVAYCFGLPICLTYIITFPFFVLFPLGIVFLLRIIKTKPVLQETSQSRGFLASKIVAALQTFRYWFTSIVTEFVGNKLAEVLVGEYDWSEIFANFLYGWYILLPFLFLSLSLFIILLLPFFALLFLVSFIFTAVFGIVTTSSIRLGALHVPSFYAPSTQSDRWSRMVVFALFGTIFGGLHCIGWEFKFPTHSERTLWRTTSLAITVIPLVVAPIDFILGIRGVENHRKFMKMGLLTLDLIMTILLFVYVPARLSLIAQALALLRNQPASALSAVDWTKYVPHLFSS